MRLYYYGSRTEFQQAIREDWYTEWSIGYGLGIPLRTDGPRSAAEAVVVLDIPRELIEAHASGRSSTTGVLFVPRDIVAAHDRAVVVSSPSRGPRVGARKVIRPAESLGGVAESLRGRT